MTGNTTWAMLKIEFKNSDNKEGGSADAKFLDLQLDCSGLSVICISSWLCSSSMCAWVTRIPEKNVQGKKGNFLINTANIATLSSDTSTANVPVGCL